MNQSLRRIVEIELAAGAICARSDEGGCNGRLTVQHPFGRVVQERWMFIYLCYEHHQGKLQNKRRDEYLAYCQTDDEGIKRTFPKTYAVHLQRKLYLSGLYAKN